MKTYAQHITTAVLAFFTGLSLVSCGGVGQDGTGATPPDTRSTGVVNGFGSVVVNGVHFDVSRAEIALDGSTGHSQSDLRVGMVVEVAGTVASDGATGTATRLAYESLLRGNIEGAPNAGIVSVLGQRVSIDDATLFESAAGITDLQAGDRIQVSGFKTPDGSLRATWVSRESSGSDLQITSTLTSVAGNSIGLSGLIIDITGAELNGVTPASLAQGQWVRVVLQAAPVGGAAAASKLSLIDRHGAEQLRKQQLQGFVAQWNASTNTFNLNGQTVQVGPTTQYQDGNLGNLSTGVRIQVVGTLNANQVLNADKLRFFPASLTGYGRGKVKFVNAGNLRFNLLDNPGGVEVRVRADTLLNDSSVAGGVLNLANLAINDEVLVLGRATSNGIDAEVVTRLPSTSPGTGVGGPARLISGTTMLTILGINAEVNGASFFDVSGVPMSQSAFLAALQQDELVRAEGVYNPVTGVLAATSVRFAR